jgi:HD-like signal output (HDOD) protein
MHHAVSMLGRARLESLILSVAVKNNLAAEKTPEWLDMRLFWRAAARRATLARGLALKLHPETQAEAFTAGLLQDMAVPVIARIKAAHYQKLYEQWNLGEGGSNLVQMEQSLLNLNHAEIGAQMARNWGFPANLIDMIANHHNSEASRVTPLAVQIVSLLKGDPTTPLEEMAPSVEQTFKLDQNVYKRLAIQAQIEADELAEALR